MPGLRITADGRVHTVMVNRPEALNAMNTALLEELLATLKDLGADDQCGVIVLTGAGDVVVVVGGTIPGEDVEELKGLGVAEVFTPGAPTAAIVDFLREKVGAAG